MKYDKLKSIFLGFEVPSIDLTATEGNEDLSRDIISYYKSSFEVIDSGLEVYELNNLHCLIYFRLAVIVDTSISSSEEYDVIIEGIKTKLSNRIKEFLELNKIIYRDING